MRVTIYGTVTRLGRMVIAVGRSAEVKSYGFPWNCRKNVPTKLAMLDRKLFSTLVKRPALLFSLVPGVKIAHCAKEVLDGKWPQRPKSTLDDVLRTADMHYEHNEMRELYDFLKDFNDSSEPELVWRLARATYELAKASAKEDEKKRLIYAAFALSEKALKLDEGNFACHKWFAILLDEMAKYEGVKYRLQRSPEVKQHFERSIELNPRDPTSHHCLGYWHYSFADLAWYQRKAAEAFFASPPTSTYSEAIRCFEHAEQVQPNFYSMNLLMLAKAYTKEKDYLKAGVYLTKLRDFNAKTVEDVKAMEEGEKLNQEVRIRIQYQSK
ncbi:Regulator of microtubule dynamics protein 1 [Hypsibius exemplaris]|uniref:Regulator of microtubule dynamics protein 1 n=1 Tax=Hypsibius exemplaris TaxID=2072580 RepID=A0A1W0X3C3_HYPEX|nr:Regulator of microtubule dynamics protein 1 [Hypsibius exemplaris]